MSFLVPVFFLLVCVAAARAEDATARQKIEGMTPGEKEQLQRLEERFEALDPAEQQRLRELHEHLEKDADAEQLRQIMQRYHEWLKTLPAYSRAELADLNPADRVKWIQKRMQEEQKRQGGKPLGPKDAEKLLRWLNESLGKQEESWLKGLPEQQRKRLMEMSPPMRHRMMVWQMIQRWQSAGVVGPPPMMSDDDLTRLRGELGPEARKRLESSATAEQWRLVGSWTRQTMRQRAGGKLGHGTPSKADDERLAQFFETELTDEERDRLLNMPGEEMQRELQRLFLSRIKPPDGPGHRPGGPDRGRRPPGDRPRGESPDRPSRPQPRPNGPAAPYDQARLAFPRGAWERGC